MDTSTSELETLRAVYCPPLDDALFYVLASDYGPPYNQVALISELDRLKAGALEQEAIDFDPSGTGGGTCQIDNAETSRSSPEDTLSNGVTSITTGITELLSTESNSFKHDLDDAPAEHKTAWLHNVFPDIPLRELAIILDSHRGSLDRATDELLNLSFLNQGSGELFVEDKSVPRGVEAFAEDNTIHRKGRKKRRNRTTESSRTSSASSCIPDSETNKHNVWSTMSADVDFICSRTDLQPQTVRSAYHANGARLEKTIQALAVNKSIAHNHSIELDAVTEIQLAEFDSGFESVPKEQLLGLLALARNMPSAARELLEAMMTPHEQEEKDDLTTATQYVPLKLDDDSKQSFQPTATTTWTGVKPHARAAAAVHQAAASQSFGQAGAAYKKSKSDRLMGGAAAYYSQIGHDRMRAAKEAHASEADALVAQQSSSTVLDLHGVSVADAVRIANNRTQNWWHGLGDTKYGPGGGGPARAGFKIVTGVGTHSKNHAPRIGPAVSKMLIREGWKVEVGHGELYVTGKNRRA